MQIPRLFVSVSVLLVAVATSVRADDPPKAKPEPLSEAALIKLAKAGIEDDVIVAIVKNRGVSFKPDDATLRRLKKGGVTEGVLAAIRKPGGDSKSGKSEASILGTGKQDAGLIVEVLETFPNKHEELMVRWRYRNPTKEKIQLIAATPTFASQNSPPNTLKKFLGGVYYVEGASETAANYRHTVLIEVDDVTMKPTGKSAASDFGRAEVVIQPDQVFEFWALFPLPRQKTQKSITLCLPETSPIRNIQIQSADAAAEAANAEKAGGPKPLATAKHETGMIVDVLDVEPTEQGEIKIRWRYRNTTKQAIQLLVPNPRFATRDTPPNTVKKFLENVFYMEGKLENDKAYNQYIIRAKDVANSGARVGPGSEFEFWAIFASPQSKDLKSITLCLPGVPPIRDLAIHGPAK